MIEQSDFGDKARNDKVELLRAELKDLLVNEKLLDNDWTLHRFLKVTDNEVAKASKMLKDFIGHRQRLNYNDLFRISPSVIEKLETSSGKFICGLSFKNELVIVDSLSILQKNKLVEESSLEELEVLLSIFWESLVRILFPLLSKITKARVEKVICIVDFKDLGVTSFFNGKLMAFLKLINKYNDELYPSIVDSVLLINVPLMFVGFWQVIRSFLSQQTNEKIVITRNDGLDRIGKIIDIKMLPENMGGESVLGYTMNNGCWKKAMLYSRANKKIELEDLSIEKEYLGIDIN